MVLRLRQITIAFSLRYTFRIVDLDFVSCSGTSKLFYLRTFRFHEREL